MKQYALPPHVLSVGGSIVSPREGFNIPFLRSFRSLIKKEIERGRRCILVIGGGAPARTYQQGLRDLGIKEDRMLDSMGIAATIFNAEFVRLFFGPLAYPHVITQPTQRIRASHAILVAAGNKPGHSTDTDAVLLAQTYGANTIVNLSNIDAVYTSDPKIDPRAKPIRDVEWKTFRKIYIPKEWRPGTNAPFDPVASRMAERWKMSVCMVNGKRLQEVRRALSGVPFNGTHIHPV